MDQIRQIRVLIAPILFVVSLVLGAHIAGKPLSSYMTNLQAANQPSPDVGSSNGSVSHVSYPSTATTNQPQTPKPVGTTLSGVVHSAQSQAGSNHVNNPTDARPQEKSDDLHTFTKVAEVGGVILAGGVLIGAITNVFFRVLGCFLRFVQFLIRVYVFEFAWVKRLFSWVGRLPLPLARGRKLGETKFARIIRLFRDEPFTTHWETVLPHSTYKNFGAILQPKGLRSDNPDSYYYAAVTFDHEILKEQAPGVHEWIVRRWNWFNVTRNSFTGLILSLILGHDVLKIPLNFGWLTIVIVVCFVLLVNGLFACCETMRMLRFHSTRIPNKDNHSATCPTSPEETNDNPSEMAG